MSGHLDHRHRFVEVRALGADEPTFNCVECGFTAATEPENMLRPKAPAPPPKSSPLPPTPLEMSMMRDDLLEMRQELEDER